jgi:hypothetical protein
MSYQAPKKPKDMIESPNHPVITRRDLLARGLVTGAMSMAIPKLLNNIGGEAFAAGVPAVCQTTTSTLPAQFAGAIGQILACDRVGGAGGPVMGARFISADQANMSASSGLFTNYGINRNFLVPVGTNLFVDSMSPFGFTLLQGPAGFPGGSTAWRANVLSKVSGGGHMGPFKDDDGGADALGLLGSMSPYKKSALGKDLRLSNQHVSATWSAGAPAASFSSPYSPTSFANVFGLTPRASGFTTDKAMSNASDAANSLSQVFSGLFGTKARKGASKMMVDAGCAFYGNIALADPNYGTKLFTPAQIPSLAGLTINSPQEQAQLAAFYRAATGEAGGVVIQYDGRDYHPGATIDDVANADVEDARSFVMFLAACAAAPNGTGFGQPGALMYMSNGNANANGQTSRSVMVDGVAQTLNVPTAVGDSGGTYNAGLIMFYSPLGAPPAGRFTGTLRADNGNVTADTNVSSVDNAVAGLYLSAFKFASSDHTIPQSLIDAMKAAGVSTDIDKLLVMS